MNIENYFQRLAIRMFRFLKSATKVGFARQAESHCSFWRAQHRLTKEFAMTTITSFDGGEFDAYLMLPASGSGPGIVLLQEIFGVNQVMRSIVDWYAQRGFVVICPDLFWRQERGVQLTDQTDAEWKRAFELYQGLDEAKAVEDAGAALAYLRGHPACAGKVGAVGFCLGGKLAYLLAVRHPLGHVADCSIGCYGVGIETVV